MTDNIKKKLLGKYGEDYVRALIFTSSAEGAFANRKADKGGITYKGISQVYNPKWVGWNIINKYLDKYPELKIPYEGKPPASIHKLNFELNAKEELEALIYDFYYENYWKKCGATAYYYDHMYLVGNNATVMYRYSVSGNAWATTNASAVAIPAVTGAVGGGCTIKWLPSYAPDKLFIVRGNATSNIYSYDLVTNTFATAAFHPSTETFTTASTHTARSIGGKGYSIISSKEATMRIYEYDPSLSRLHPKMNQWLYPTGAAVQGDRATCLRSPDEVEFYYLLLPSSTAFVRCALIDS